MDNTKNITIIDFPEPEREPLNIGDEYYVMSIMADCVLRHEWQDTELDYDWLELGLIQKTEEGAEQHREAVLSITSEVKNNV